MFVCILGKFLYYWSTLKIRPKKRKERLCDDLKWDPIFFWVISTVVCYKQVTVILAEEWNEGLELFGMLLKTLSLNRYRYIDLDGLGYGQSMEIVRFWGMLELQGSVAEWLKLHYRKELFGPLLSNRPQVCREGFLGEAGGWCIHSAVQTSPNKPCVGTCSALKSDHAAALSTL